jgi:hypothetical protein
MEVKTMKKLILILTLLFILCNPLISATTYYYVGNGGNDGNTGLSHAQRWLTLQYAFDNASAADSVLYIEAGTWNITTKIDIDTNAHTYNQPIRVIGIDSGGVGTETMVTIDGSGISSDDLFNINIANGCYVFRNLTLSGATEDNVNATDYRTTSWYNCRFTGATDDGFYDTETQARTCFSYCSFDTNGTGSTGNGFAINGAGRGRYDFYHCVAYDNKQSGLLTSAGWASDVSALRPNINHSLFYSNGTHGVELFDGSDYCYYHIKNCTFANNTLSGLFTDNAEGGYIEFCIFAHNSDHGIDTNTGTVLDFDILRNCAVYDNTNGHIDINGGTLPGHNHVTTNPSFTSVVDGSENYTPTNGTDYEVAVSMTGGTNYEWIGAITPVNSGGGSTVVVKTGKTGGKQ